jgi:lysyl-tRNA synthetase class 2
MPWEKTNSSMIDAFEYDPAFRVLHIQFRSGRIHSLEGVPAEVATAFSEAESKGKFFHANLRDQYRAI